MKKCSKCNVEKELNEFPKSQSCKDGHVNQCKICRSEYYNKYNKEYREKNKEYYIKKNREYKKNNKEHIKEYYKKNKEYYKEKNKQYREKNKEYYNKYNKEYREKQKEKLSMIALYKDLSVEGVHDNGEDIYLSDGVYLKQNGEMYCEN
jgi:hypothetical protein